MRVKILVISGFLLSFSIGFMVGQIILVKTQKPIGVVQQVIDRSLDKYSIPAMTASGIAPGQITVEKQLKDYPDFTSNEFLMKFNANLDGKTMATTSGLVNIPKGEGKFPLVVMIRGYVPPAQYFVGNGTINGSLFFAKNGFITIAPDFLGYGDSDKEPTNVFEARFQTYTAVMALLKAANQINEWDKRNIFIWAHSNGGNIALTTLEVTGVSYPTALWAPVSSPFPFSILYYSDETNDHGKGLRKELSRFEDVYNADYYSLSNYLGTIKAPIQLNQGTADDSVPVDWSNTLAKSLKENGNQIEYNIIPGADHQMDPHWNEVIQKDLDFFEKNLQK